MPLLLVIAPHQGLIPILFMGHDNVSNGTSADIFGINRTNSTSNSLLLGNGSYTNIRANSTCDLGTSSIPFQNIYSNSSLVGPVNSRTVDNVISNTSPGTLNNIVSFVSDKVIKDSGIAASTLSGGLFTVRRWYNDFRCDN